MDSKIVQQRLGPARRRVLADEVADSIRGAIVSGKLTPGQRLIEEELANQLNVSRAPIRVALIHLGQEGLVVSERHRGASVAKLSADDIEKIYSLRSALERLAADWACRNATDQDLEDMAVILAHFDSLPRPVTRTAAARLDLDFHDVLHRAAHHEPLYRAWLGLRTQVFLFITQRGAWRADFAKIWHDDHAELLELVRNHKRSLAIRLVERHNNSTYQRVHEANHPFPRGQLSRILTDRPPPKRPPWTTD
jgi:DNA-binding GntR family transcriptional regulator